jgi:hypothetical protein
MDAYLQFLKNKVARAQQTGFEPPSPPHPSLFGHQAYSATYLCRGGRRACFENFGLGKTRINIQCGKWVIEQTGGKYLIVAPLGVRQEFTQSDGPAMGVDIEYVRTDAEAFASAKQMVITNYERVRDADITPSKFAGAGLDEAACLRSFGADTYQNLLRSFKGMKYKWTFTATPSPNRTKELLHFGAFLEIMDSGDALTRFFQRDSQKAGNLTLMPHMAARFWQWLHSWALFVTKPSDLGFSDDGYILPPLRIHWHRIEEDARASWGNADSWGQFQLIPTQAEGLTQSAHCKRNSIQLRIEKAKQIMASYSPRKWIVWHDLEDERREIERSIDPVVTIFGSMELESREQRIMDFSNGLIDNFGTKPVISGAGCNFQKHCADMIFPGIGYKFHDLIQACHRVYRFGQTREVNIHLLYLDSEEKIKNELQRKWANHDELMARMSQMVREQTLKEAA